ncbi:MAG TPA: hypothetical protein VN688_10735 [Gemmataceae bacterium]|nr:hypothetical protein [Gemmataceae bacterium]
MSIFDPAITFASAERPDYLSAPPRPVALNLRAGWLRAGFLAGLLLAPPLVLFLGQTSGENLRALAAQGSSTTGQLVLRG